MNEMLSQRIRRRLNDNALPPRAPQHPQDVGPTESEKQQRIQRLEQQIHSLRELVDMLPVFQHNVHWQTLLREHIAQITLDIEKDIYLLRHSN
ncbi:MAG: hypothetical protein HC914_03745 [Chloroflexaceae bacterium]|nr:hypothetical protein [Chloroflexaceae bacterium]